jgi:hypothetical protein
MVFNDSLWNIHEAGIIIDSNAISVKNIRINKNDQEFLIDGKISENKDDELRISFTNFILDNLNLFTRNWGIELHGKVNGTSVLANYYKDPYFDNDITIDSLIVNNEGLGETRILSHWYNTEKELKYKIISRLHNMTRLHLAGNYFPENKEISFNARMNKMRLDLLNPYLKDNFSDIRGIASGDVNLTGTVNKPLINGSLKLQKTSFTVDYLKTRYSFTDDLSICDNNLLFDNTILYDQEANKAEINGKISSNNLRNIGLDIKIETPSFLFLNTNEKDNNLFYGRGLGSGIVHFYGSPGNLTIDISAKTEGNSMLHIPMYTSESVENYDFITFTGPVEEEKNNQTVMVKKPAKKTNDNSGVELNFDLEITPDMKAQIIFDSKLGDVIKATGNSNFKMQLDRNGRFTIFGEYVIEEGDYLFTLRNLINKKFEIESGSKIIYSGDIEEGELDVVAVYKTKGSVNTLLGTGLLGDTTQTQVKRVPVDCKIYLTGNMYSPEKRFDIELPTVDAQTQEEVSLLLNTDEKLIRQFLSLLVLNNFYPDPEITGINNGVATNATGGVGTTGMVTTSELLSNQLSHWLSQISNDLDIGVNYRPGDQLTTDEVEVALGAHLLNDRVSITGNIDMGGNEIVPTTEESTTSNIVGDFILDIKLNKSGKLRAKAFNRENDDILFKNSQYTQGVGIVYRKEFERLFGKREDDEKEKNDQTD